MEGLRGRLRPRCRSALFGLSLLLALSAWQRATPAALAWSGVSARSSRPSRLDTHGSAHRLCLPRAALGAPGDGCRPSAGTLHRREGLVAALSPALLPALSWSPAEAAAAQPPPIAVAGSAKPMPALGFGTCCRRGSQGPPLIQAAKFYLASGGRLIDTAQLYENHKDVAVAIRESKIPRDELWVTSKVDPTEVRTREEVVQSVDRSLRELGLEYIDLMLLHGAEGWGIAPDEDQAFWKGLIDAQKAGKVRNIGVSNHNRREIERLTAATGVQPAVNQIEYHPWVPKETKDLVRWCQDRGIAVTAYGSLGGAGNKAQGEIVEDVAEARGGTNAQVLLRWAIDQGVAVIPGASSESHIKENLDVMAVSLGPKDVAALEGAERPYSFRRWHSCKSGCAD